MAESGLGGRFWFSAATCGKDCRNVTYKERIKSTPCGFLYGEKKDVSKFRPFGCRGYMWLNKERREKGKTAPRAIEVINLGFASDLNTSAYKVYVEKTGQILTSNQLEFDEGLFPYRKEEMISRLDEGDSEIDILYKASTPIRWLTYTSDLHLATFKKVHMGSDRLLILQAPNDPAAYLKIDQETFFRNLLSTATIHEKARMASAHDRGNLTRVKGLPDSIDPTKPPKNFRDAMMREDCQEWAAALDKEYMGFKLRGVFELVPLKKGMKLPRDGSIRSPMQSSRSGR